MADNKLYQMTLDSIYPLYIAKIEKKGRNKSELDEVTCWLTGYNQEQLDEQIEKAVTLESFFTTAPAPHPNRVLITGSICGVKISEISEPMTKEIRYLDKLVDELAKGKAMEKILRK